MVNCQVRAPSLVEVSRQALGLDPQLSLQPAAGQHRAERQRDECFRPEGLPVEDRCR